WQRIELDIQGDHVLPYVHRGSLYVAWPLLTQRQSSSDWQLTFQWSKLDGNSWRRAESVRDSKDLSPVAFRTRETAFTFRCLVGQDQIRLGCYALPVPQNSLSSSPGLTASVQQSGPLDGSRRNEFNARCVSGRFQDYGHLVVPSDQTPNKVRIAQPSGSHIMGAVHVVTWECWIKAKGISGTGYIRIDSDPGGTTSPRVFLQTSIGSGRAAARQIGWDLGLWVADYPQFEVPEATCWAEYLGPSGGVSGMLPLPAVARGSFQRTHLRMIIEPRAGTEPPTLAELGISTPASQLRPIASLTLPDFSQGYWDDHNSLPVPDYHPGTHGQFNGMQGGGQDSWPLFLPASPPRFSDRALAAGALGGETQRDYWLLPVSDQPKAAQGSTAWFYRQGATSCFLDQQVSPTRIDVNGYSASFPEAQPILREWQQTRSLDGSQTLTITYGASLLPVPQNDANAKQWQDQVRGVSAFDAKMPYACYSWEVLFHAPLLIADQLSKQQRFEEAERWLRCVFDPTSGGNGNDPKRFFRFQVFKDLDPRNDVTKQLTLLAQGASGSGASVPDVEEVKQLIARWRETPFRPFVIARRRHIAFLWRTVFAYLDNLFAWADSLYRRDTRESIGEASLLYVLVARILGPRPKLREKGSQRPARSYDSVQDQWDDFGNLWVDTTRSNGALNRVARVESGLQIRDPLRLPSSGGFLFFCLPNNDKLSTYWNMVESRLFNIRHCRNIEGISRQLPLTDPQIDPELLIRATAAGLDLGQVIAGLYAPPPHYRFSVLAARASELAAETRTLGGAVLAAIEKRDAERLSQLRSANELAMLERVEAVRRLQIEEAEANLQSLRATRTLT
ncbi:MAG: hypothetical protein ING30_07115, partial [Burkholderiales bacterium]|nr:hypothetical protein [Burkholderiales bacterium]